MPGINDIDKALWLKSNSANLVMNDNKISQWNDLSGKGRHATQSNNQNAPLYNSADNSVYFTGASWFDIDLDF